MQGQKQYNPTIDILRVISILAVILIHTTTRTLEASLFNLQNFSWVLFLNQASRFAVPLFFMISGFVLELNYHLHESYLSYLKKRINRILIPYFFWSAVYYFFIYTKHTENFLQTIISGDASYQLYFIPSLILFYLIFPFIHKYYNLFFNKWAMLILVLLQFLILSFDYYIHPLPFFYPISITLLNFFIFFFGIFVSRNLNKLMILVKKWRFILFFITFILALFVFYEGESLYLKTQNYLSFYSQWRPSVLVYTIFLAGFLYYLLNRSKLNTSIVKTFSKLSFFVFFVHVIVLEEVWKFFGKDIFYLTKNNILGQLWFAPLFFFAVAFISFFTAFLIHKVPKLSKLTG